MDTNNTIEIQKELTNLTTELNKRKAGRPKGSFRPPWKTVMRNEQLSREEKLLILSNIARDNETNNSDKIKAIQAHQELSGETNEGYQKLIIKVELADAKDN